MVVGACTNSVLYVLCSSNTPPSPSHYVPHLSHLNQAKSKASPSSSPGSHYPRMPPSPLDLAAIIYTSGTTGMDGCMCLDYPYMCMLTYVYEYNAVCVYVIVMCMYCIHYITLCVYG
ncbi:hypothetical protein EON65_05300 [archaeon]|nr:MAG: hypothetical protein EON65_05300 [archaeon]